MPLNVRKEAVFQVSVIVNVERRTTCVTYVGQVTYEIIRKQRGIFHFFTWDLCFDYMSIFLMLSSPNCLPFVQ